VAREDDTYVIRILNCFDAAKPISLNGLAIKRLDGRRRFPHCSLSWSGTNDRPITEWRYGASTAGYAVRSCLRLQTTQRYEIEIRAGAGGRAQFFVESDGNVRMIDDGCGESRR
jgi:hypothetical protein